MFGGLLSAAVNFSTRTKMPGFQFGKALDLLVGLCASSACGWLHLEASMVVRRGRPVHSIMLGADNLS